MYIFKSWSSVGKFIPALQHQSVYPCGAVIGTWQNLSVPDHLNDILVGITTVRLQAIAENFPQHNSVWPYIRINRKLAIHNSLRGHPPDRKKGISHQFVVISSINFPEKAQIRYFHIQFIEHQYISSGQVLVDNMVARKIFHSCSYLSHNVKKVCRFQSGFYCLVIISAANIRVGRSHHQELMEITVGTITKYHTYGLFLCHYSQQTNYVWVL